VNRLGRELGFDHGAIGLAVCKKQRTVYFDTPCHDLHAAGFSLRLRWQDGHWLQTIKANRRVANDISNAADLENRVATHKPDLAKVADKEIRRAFQKTVKGKPLRPVFETVIRWPSRKTKAQSNEVGLSGNAAVRASEKHSPSFMTA